MKFTIFKRMISGYAVIMVIFMGIYVTLKLNQMMEINHKIAKADGGTFFLDEISEMPLTMQAKFLRVLGDMAFYPFGGQRMVQVNVRMIAASNKNLEEVVKSGRFREDLFYRIHVIHIPIPPLGERKEDSPLLARHFLRKYAEKAKKDIAGFSPAALQRLIIHPWPGNVRELENCVESAVAMTHREVIPEDVIF